MKTSKPKYIPVFNFSTVDDTVALANALLNLESKGYKYSSDKYKAEAREFVRTTFVQYIASYGMYAVAEVKFSKGRRWRIDYVVSKEDKSPVRVALEVEGGVWSFGRHTRGSGFVKDMEKYNEVARNKMFVVRVTPLQLFTEYTINLLKDIIL